MSEVAPFCIDKTEVTQALYERYERLKGIQNGWATHLSKYIKETANKFKIRGPYKPVVLVIFEEAQAYCKAKGGDLPTSPQWEKAMRGPYGKEYGTKSGIFGIAPASNPGFNFFSGRSIEIGFRCVSEPHKFENVL